MKIGRLNIFEGRIKRVTRHPSSADVTVELVPGVEVRSRLTTRSFEALRPRRGQMASVVIPNIDVIIAPS